MRELANGSNDNLKNRLRGRGYLVAQKIGTHPTRLSEKLRYRLTDQERQQIEQALREVILSELEAR